MTALGEREFLLLLVLNALAVVIYLLWCFFLKIVLRRNTKSLWVKAAVMLLCPVIGICFFLLGYLFYRGAFFVSVDLEDVVFSKERITPTMPAEEERESNMVPIEEALAVTDKDNLRNVMLNVVKGSDKSSLAAISLALKSDDSEVTHYAATALQSVLNDFRAKVKREYERATVVKEDETEEERSARLDAAAGLIDYMAEFMDQRLLPKRERAQYALRLDELCELLSQWDPERMTAKRFEAVSMELLQTDNYEKCRERCLQAYARYPDELEPYACQLKLYYSTGERDQFFRVLGELRASDIAMDSGTLELVRVFL